MLQFPAITAHMALATGQDARYESPRDFDPTQGTLSETISKLLEQIDTLKERAPRP
jgi:hypothetical protein